MQPKYFATSLEHILAELERINLVIQMHVQQAREVYERKGDFQGFFISKQEVEWLMKRPIGTPNWATSREHLFMAESQTKLDRMVEEIAQSKSESTKQGVTLRLERLSRLFRLNPFDIDTLLICFAPEIDLRYERVYGYLQDDITRKKPSVDLVLSLLCSSLEKNLTARNRFNPDSPLFRYHFLSVLDDPHNPNTTLLGQNLKVDKRIVSYLLDQNAIDDRLKSFSDLTVPQIRRNDLILPEATMKALSALISKEDLNDNCLILYLQGPYGVGKRSTAEALCNSFGKKLLIVDTNGLQKSDKLSFENLLRRIEREALIEDAVINWNHFDYLLAEDRREDLNAFLKIIGSHKGLTVISGNKSWEPKSTQHNLQFISIKILLPPFKDRLRHWENALNGDNPSRSEVDLSSLSNKFRFSGGQIQDVIAAAKNRILLKPSNNSCLNMKDLYGACRVHSNQKLAELSKKIKPKFTWCDIVLPTDKFDLLNEIINHVKYKQKVYADWGFEEKMSLGKGLTVLFSGPSGTGKTMAAEIIAGELDLDIYKIDLSLIVSKYIGETEKNLSKIFAEAETSNSILFFDEADALFGKRSEVKDSHDRYANIEIAYLLQKMEEYEGITILASNLRKNLDDAFVRRIKFIIEFPVPDESHRHQIWQVHLPDQAPLGDDLDFEFLARQFKLTGGNIKNTVLHAAFLSASKESAISMKHIIQGIQREYQKVGKICVQGDFGKYFKLIDGNVAK